MTVSDFYYEQYGFCPICQAPARFVARNAWFRDHFLCETCGSLPRQRALIQVIDSLFPGWPGFDIFEASPGGPATDRLKRQCPRYVSSYCYPGVPLGTIHDGFRCEDVERLTFPDASFDLVVTQEVFEHVFDYRRGYQEVMRVLRPGGAHVFTTPKYWHLRRSEDCAIRRDGQIVHLREPEYHGNPIDEGGSLVTVHYGDDLPDIIWHATRCPTTAYVIRESRTGTIAEFMDVFVTRKL
ncbi:MAG: class I SAM-dependent methyltransferase [Vicinamibacterales bacterium]